MERSFYPAYYDQHQRLLGLIASGTLTPAQAEEEATQLRIPPLRKQRPQAEFDPMSKRHWDLPSVLAWITWRTRGALSWVHYRQYSRQEEWVPRGAGYALLEPEPFAPNHLTKADLGPRHDGCGTARMAFDQLRFAAFNGRLRAWGVQWGEMRTELIGEMMWFDLRLDFQRWVVVSRLSEHIGYYDVIFDATEVQKCWKPVTRKATPDERSACCAWLCEQMRISPKGTDCAKPAWYALWKLEFAKNHADLPPGATVEFPRYVFDQEWREAIKLTKVRGWDHSGRKRKTKGVQGSSLAAGAG